jgi:hypothetical protein
LHSFHHPPRVNSQYGARGTGQVQTSCVALPPCPALDSWQTADKLLRMVKLVLLAFSYSPASTLHATASFLFQIPPPYFRLSDLSPGTAAILESSCRHPRNLLDSGLEQTQRYACRNDRLHKLTSHRACSRSRTCACSCISTWNARVASAP